MRLFKLIQLFFLILFISCEDKSSAEKFSLTIDLVIKENDSLHVFYLKNNSINFNEENSFWQKVKGKEKNQKVKLVFPKNILPKQIRIDFGRNKKQQDIVLNKIQFNYKSKNRDFKGKEVYEIFRIDESCTVLDKKLGILKRKEKNQLNGPSLYPRGERLHHALLQFYKNN